MSTNRTPDPHAAAVRHLARRCPLMKDLIARVGPCTWAAVSPDPFTVLVWCIVYQQLSTKAAGTIFARLAATVGGVPIARDRLAALTETDFRACGVSGPKQRALRALADHVAADPALLVDTAARDDALLREQLTAIKGIGPWSVHMFLMFGLLRPDVLPVGDLGLRMGVRDEYGLADLPSPAELEAVAEKWKPYRSVATWYFWRSRGFVPQTGRGG